MTLPVKVQEQGDRADELMKDLFPSIDGEPEPSDAGDGPEPEPAKAAEPGPQLIPELGLGKDLDIGKKSDEGDYRQMYLTLKGKYDSEVPYLRETVDALAKESEELRAAVSDIRDKKDTPPVASIQTSEDLRRVMDDLGEDIVRPIINAAVQQALEQMKPLQTEFKTVTDALAQSRQAEYEKGLIGMFAQLDKDYPEWRGINQSREFLDWLQTREYPSDRHTYQVRLTEARNALDIQKIIGVFELYKRATGNGGDAEKPGGPQVDPKLASMISPNASKSGAPTPQQKRTYSKAEVTRFYDDLRRAKATGIYPNLKARFDSMEADITYAAMEGRVT